jgi:uncharacterized GH25 family protein
MLKIPLFFLLAITAFVLPAIAQNTNIAIKSNGAVRSARALSNTNAAPEVPPANSTLRGRVYYEDTGRPVKRASLMLLDVGRNGPGEFSALTDGDGEFVIRNVKAGSYFAMVNAPGVVSPMAFLDIGSVGRETDSGAFDEAAANFEKIEVDGVNETVVQIAAKRGGAVSGRIVYENGDPAIGVRVEVLRKAGGKFMPVVSNLSSLMAMFSGGLGSGQADDRGMFRFSGLPAGEYVVKVSESAQHTVDNNKGPRYGAQAFEALFFGGSSFLTFYFPDAAEVKDAQILNVLMGQELGEINITIPDKSLFKLSGKVISMKNKKPLAGAKVSLQTKNDNVVSLFGDLNKQLNTAVTDEEGNWNFKELPKGDYSVMVEPGTSPGEYGDYPYAVNTNANTGGARPKNPPEPKYAKKFQALKLEDKDLTDVVIELGYGAMISGTVSVENNKEMPSQTVSIVVLGEKDEMLASASVWNSSEDDEESYVRTPQKGGNDFKMENVSAGKVRFRFSVADKDYYVKSARAGMTDLMTEPLEMKEGDVFSNVKVILANDTGTLKGKILDNKDRPASGVLLLLVPTDAAKKRSPNFFKNVRSDAEGKFQVKLPPGEYFILFLKPGIADGEQAAFNGWLDEALKNADKVSISADGTSTVTLKKPGQ